MTLPIQLLPLQAVGNLWLATAGANSLVAGVMARALAAASATAAWAAAVAGSEVRGVAPAEQARARGRGVGRGGGRRTVLGRYLGPPVKCSLFL